MIKKTIHGYRNIATGFDIALSAVFKSAGQNLPERLCIDWLKASGGLLSSPQIFRPQYMDLVDENGFKFYKDYLQKTSLTGNRPVTTVRIYEPSKSTEYIRKHCNYEGSFFEDILSLNKARTLIYELANKYSLKIRSVEQTRLYDALGVYALKPKKILFSDRDDIKIGTVLHEVAHALFHQKVIGKETRFDPYYIDYHPTLFHLLNGLLHTDPITLNFVSDLRGSSEPEEITLGDYINFLRSTGVNYCMTETQSLEVLGYLSLSLLSPFRHKFDKKPPNFPVSGSPPIICQTSGFEIIWPTGNRGRHYSC